MPFFHSTTNVVFSLLARLRSATGGMLEQA